MIKPVYHNRNDEITMTTNQKLKAPLSINKLIITAKNEAIALSRSDSDTYSDLILEKFIFESIACKQ